MRLEGKVALITGASSGIGWAAAEAFAAEGACLALAARRQDKLEELGGKLKGRAQLLAFDVSETEKAGQLIKKVVDRWGRLDLLINNAGVMSTARFHEQSLGEMEAVMKTNYLGSAALAQAAIRVMLRQGSGHIVNVASMAGLMGLPYMAAYSASKHAVAGLTESLRREYYGTGLTLTLLCPGSVDTAMSADSLKDEELGRLARPKTAAQVAEQIVASCVHRSEELIYGDAPGLLLKLSKLAPGLSDWLVHKTYQKAHPLNRR